MTLKETMIDALIKEGYGVAESIEHANKFMEEIKTYPKGKHKIYVGKHIEITFRKE